MPRDVHDDQVRAAEDAENGGGSIINMASVAGSIRAFPTA